MASQFSSGLSSSANARKKLAFYKKIQAQKNQGNSAKAQNLTARYRAKVATRNLAAGDTSTANTNPITGAKTGGQYGSQYNTGKLSTNAVLRGLSKYAGVSGKARKRTLAATRRLRNTTPPGTPGGTY